MNTRPETPLFVLALVTVIACAVLIALNHEVPTFLQAVVLAAVTGAAGVTTPRSGAQGAPQASAAVIVAEGTPQ